MSALIAAVTACRCFAVGWLWPEWTFLRAFRTVLAASQKQGNIENIRYGSIEHKGIPLHLFDSIKFVFPKIAIAQ